MKKNESDEDAAKILCLKIADDLENGKISLKEAARITHAFIDKQKHE